MTGEKLKYKIELILYKEKKLNYLCWKQKLKLFKLRPLLFKKKKKKSEYLLIPHQCKCSISTLSDFLWAIDCVCIINPLVAHLHDLDQFIIYINYGFFWGFFP